MKNITKSLYECVEAIPSLIFTIALFVAYVVGISKGFDQSVEKGVFNIVIFPYGVYRGAATLWEKPEWERNWNYNVSKLAVVILSSTDDRLENQLELRHQIHLLNLWSKELPKKERNQLESQSKLLCNAIDDFMSSAITALSEGKQEVKPSNLKNSNPIFEREFLSSMKEAQVQIAFFASKIDTNKISSEQIVELLKPAREFSQGNCERKVLEIFHTN